MKIGMIGAGKVGCSMGKYMVEQGLSVAGYFSRRMESSEEAGTFTGTKAFGTLESVIQESDMLCIAVPDDAILDVWQEMQKVSHLLTGKIVCHFSGSISSAVFSNIEETGAYACSLHPMSAFSDKFTSYQQLHQVMFTMEGDGKATQVVGDLFRGMGNPVLTILPEKKALYHCSASLLSNFMVGLYDMGLQLLCDCGLSEEEARLLTTPLIENNVQAMLSQGTEKALTGPIERGDVGTVMKHLDALACQNATAKNVYEELGTYVLQVAQRKNPQRKYEEMEQIFVHPDIEKRMEK